MNPDELRNAYQRVWLDAYLRRQPRTRQQQEIDRLEAWWQLPAREERG